MGRAFCGEDYGYSRKQHIAFFNTIILFLSQLSLVLDILVCFLFIFTTVNSVFTKKVLSDLKQFCLTCKNGTILLDTAPLKTL